MTDVLRPADWGQYIGQVRMKQRVKIHVDACIHKVRPMAHMLIVGPPGTGKTAFAELIDQDMPTLHPMEKLVMPIDDKVLMQIVLEHSGILFLDEIHRAKKSMQEDLLPLLEFGYLQRRNGGRLEAPWITVVAATTEPEGIIPTLYDRFPIKFQLADYEPEEMETIVRGMLSKVELTLPEETVGILSNATAGIPRNARQFVLAATDLRDIGEDPTTEAILHLTGITKEGFNEKHIEYLQILRNNHGKAGLTTISNLLRLHPAVIRDLERLLVARDMINYTPSGRELTSNGYLWFKKAPVTA